MVGGNSGTADVAAVEAYDPVADTWTTVSWERLVRSSPDFIAFVDYDGQTFEDYPSGMARTKEIGEEAMRAQGLEGGWRFAFTVNLTASVNSAWGPVARLRVGGLLFFWWAEESYGRD